MGTTPNYSWPYPESSDFVADGATAIENLADAIDTTVDTFGKWTTYTPVLTNITLGTGGTNAGRYAVINKTLIVSIYLELGTGGSMGTGPGIGLPVGFTRAGNASLARGICRPPGTGAQYWITFSVSSTSYGPLAENVASTYPILTTITSAIPASWVPGGWLAGTLIVEVT